MLKFILYEDDKKYMESNSEIINKVMINHNFDYRIIKCSTFDDILKKEILANDDDERIYILDIEAPKTSGLEIAAKIRERNWRDIIIFVTNYSKYKNDVFLSRLMVLDYVEKSFNYKDRFLETISVAISAVGKNDLLTYTLKHVVYRIPISNINYIEKATLGKKSYISTTSGEEYEMISTMNDLQEKLGNNFFRSHKSCLVNLNNIKSINYVENTITFLNGDTIDLLSVRCKKGLKKVCNK